MNINDKSSHACMITTFVLIFLVIGGGGLTVFWLAFKHGQYFSILNMITFEYLPEDYIPHRLMISNKYYIPNIIENIIKKDKDFWMTSVNFLLMSLFKGHAIDSNFFNESYFIEFSDERIKQLLYSSCFDYIGLEFCENHKDITPRLFHDILLSQTNFTQYSLKPEFFTPMQDSLTFDAFKFEVAESCFLSSIFLIRKHLVLNEAPLMMSFPVIKSRYWKDCDDPLVNNTYECSNKLRRCQYNSSNFCGPFDIEQNDFLNSNIEEFVVGEPQAYVVIGYTDQFTSTSSTNKYAKGGFIVRSSKFTVGHSLEYLFGNISSSIENSLCLEKNNLYNWIPASLSCLSLYSTSCSSDMSIDEKIFNGATKLRCINSTFCNVNNTYYVERDEMLRKPKFYMKNGIRYCSFIEYDSSGSLASVTINIPYDHINSVLTYYDDVDNISSSMCGYSFIPYDLYSRARSFDKSVEVGSYRIDLSFQLNSQIVTYNDRKYEISNLATKYDINTRKNTILSEYINGKV